MSFVYPRTISINRPNDTTDVGDRGYSAQRGPINDTRVVVEGLPASIQLDRQGQHNPVGLPTDADHASVWKVFIPAWAAARGLIQTTDVVVDDLGIAYQVFAPHWDSLGYQLRCTLLEV